MAGGSRRGTNRTPNASSLLSKPGSQFPFKADDDLEILIQGDKLLVQRVGKGR